MSKKVAFVGLGVMGYPMAGHLSTAGHQVSVYNRTVAKSDQWAAEHGGTALATPREAAAGAEFVMICVGNDNDLRSVVYGDDGVLAGMKAGSSLVDHTTASAEVARELHAHCKELGIAFIDAPVSGGQAGAENGALAIMCGGEQDAYNAAEPILAAYGKNVALIGEPGAGQLTKMVNQICIAGLVQALSEGVNFAQSAGLDVEKVMGVVGGGAAASWQLSNRYETMARDEFEFGFAVDWMRKDLSIVIDEARRNGASVPVTAMVDQYYADVQKMGGNRWDTSSLIARLKKFS
ncbi:oxidoreductase [Chromatiales bacterium (ex Bugula neritina AB1)]|nr:oxidoreductase [Chromatiales bacterium (ex Bugula neritina AB1)]